MDTDAQKQLLDMAERLVGVGHWRFDVASGRITWSAETYRIHGLSQSDAEPDYAQLLSLYSSESADLLAGLVDRAIATGQGYELEATIRRPDGAIRYVAAKAECILGADKKVEMLIGVFQDITERTQAERFMRALTNYIPAMVAYWDTNLRCRYANEQYREWFGRSPEDMLGISMQELMGPELFERNAPFIRGAISGQRQTFERTLTKPSGEVGHTLARYIPDVDEMGRVAGFVVLVTDVTELKETELSLKQATAAAEQARAQIQGALAVRTEFLSNISHELRTPLTAIIGFSEILAKQQVLTGEGSKYLHHIGAASADLMTAVNDLLDFSKLEAGQLLINVSRADPFAVGLGALNFFELQLLSKRLSMTFSARDLPPALLIDQVRVRQVLLNLIGNAVKFTTRGGVSVFGEYDHSRHILRYTVSDTGPGVPLEHQEKLFRRFSQVDGSKSPELGGTGLGLAICKGLAEAMGGSVGFYSTIGEGSQFWLEIPCETPSETGEIDSESAAIQDPVDALNKLRLLVVDDHPANRELVSRILEPLGVVVVHADSGKAAVALAEEDQFSIILLDIVMPEMDGAIVARMIRSGSGLNRSRPIIAFTAGGDRDMRAEWTGLFSDLLPKPFAAIDLLNVLMRHLPARAP